MKRKSRKNLRFYGSKLAYSIVDKIADNNVTSNDIQVLLYFALVQDAKGCVYGIHYDKISNLFDMVKQTFYNTLENLVEKGFITRISEVWGYWDIQINDNIFETHSDDKKGYINVNRELLFSDEFIKLKANEKKLALLLLKKIREGKVYRAYAKVIAKWLGIKSTSMAIIYRYCENISFMFSNIRTVGKKTNLGDLVLFTSNVYELDKTYQHHTEFEHHFIHKIQHFLRANKLLSFSDKVKEIVGLINQYKSKGIDRVMTTITKLLACDGYSAMAVSYYLQLSYSKWASTFL